MEEAARKPHPLLTECIEYLESKLNTFGLFLKLAYICKKEYKIELDFGENWMYKAMFALYVNLHEHPERCKKEFQSFCIASHIDNLGKDDFHLDLQTCNEIAYLLEGWVWLLIPRLNNPDDKKRFYNQHRSSFDYISVIFMGDVYKNVEANDAIFKTDPFAYTAVSVMSEQIDLDNFYDWYSRSQNAWFIVRYFASDIAWMEERGDDA